MTKNLLSILTGLMLMLFVPTVQSQLLVEDFDYSAGSLLTDNGWTAHSAETIQPVDVLSTGLTFPGYKGSDIGGAANLDNNGQDVNRVFEAQTSGTVYVASIIKIDDSTTAGYFMHLGKATIGSTFFSRVFVNATGDGVGFNSSSTTPTSFIPVTKGVPFMLVIKYDFAAAKSSMFVLNDFAATEPASPAVQIDETNTEIGSVALRQYNSAQKIVVDGIRVATTWADAVAPAGAITKVSTPNLNPGGGSFVSPVQVEITSATEGATIYYTLDNSTPDNTKTQYTGPVTISTTTTLKAIAYKTGLDASNVAVSTYTFPTEVATIAALREYSTGLIKLTGEAVLTLKSADRNAKYIQDATGAVLIDDAGGMITTNYAVGDGITGITGTLGAYGGMLQFTPVADPGPATSTGNTVTPKAVALNEIANYPGQLVTVSGVTIDGEGVFAARTNYNLNGSSSVVVRTAYNDLPYIETGIPQGPLDITGLVLIFNETVQLVPRTAADMVPVVITAPTILVSEPQALYGVNVGQSVKDTVYVDGFNLTGNVTVSLSGPGAAAFTVSPASIAPTAGALDKAQVEIVYQPAAAGDHVATLTFSSAGAVDVVKSLSGKAFAMNGDGSSANPFTVGDVLAMNNSLGTAQKYWVKGYITGTVTSGADGVLTSVATAAPFAATSLALADASAEVNLAVMIPVQLPFGDLRTALNLNDNPGNLGKQVAVYGTLETYFNVAGVKNVTEYSILTGLPAVDADRYQISVYDGQLDITSADPGTVEVFNTVGQLLYSGSLNIGQNVIPLNQSGVLLVKVNGAIRKVMM